MTETRPKTVGCFLALTAVVLALILIHGVDASPASLLRENIPLNSEIFTQPEYVEALAKEMEKEATRKYHRGGLDTIGGGNIFQRNVDQIGEGKFERRNLDHIGGGNLLRRVQYQPSMTDVYYDY